MKRPIYLGALALIACQPADRHAPDSTRNPSDRLVDAAAHGASSTDETCGSDTLATHPGARVLLDEVLERNARGEQAHGEATAWWRGVSECPDHAPGWDTSILVTGWRVDTLAAHADTVVFIVHFAELGTLAPGDSGQALTVSPRDHADTITVIRGRHSWRLARYGVDLFLLPDAARTFVTDGTRLARILDSLKAATSTRRMFISR